MADVGVASTDEAARTAVEVAVLPAGDPIGVTGRNGGAAYGLSGRGGFALIR